MDSKNFQNLLDAASRTKGLPPLKQAEKFRGFAKILASHLPEVKGGMKKLYEYAHNLCDSMADGLKNGEATPADISQALNELVLSGADDAKMKMLEWNKALKRGEITAKETLPIGINFAFLPSLAVVKDIRWGQTYESYSENHETVSLFISAFLNGIQGKNIKEKYSLLACMRGFPGEGSIDKGIHYGNIKVE